MDTFFHRHRCPPQLPRLIRQISHPDQQGPVWELLTTCSGHCRVIWNARLAAMTASHLLTSAYIRGGGGMKRVHCLRETKTCYVANGRKNNDQESQVRLRRRNKIPQKRISELVKLLAKITTKTLGYYFDRSCKIS